jgi:hypothetical protein
LIDFSQLLRISPQCCIQGAMTSIKRQAEANLIRLAQAWCDATGGTLSAAGRSTTKDSRFFTGLIARHESGDPGSFTFQTHDNIVEWFRENWPKRKPFPHLDDLTYRPKKSLPVRERGSKQVRKAERIAAAE